MKRWVYGGCILAKVVVLIIGNCLLRDISCFSVDVGFWAAGYRMSELFVSFEERLSIVIAVASYSSVEV